VTTTDSAATGAPTVVIGTAGHIDHGKTSLLRALTGIDADRLPEERARGMTIDVGYAHLAFDDGVELDFVDVPGHDRLIGNMLVGAGEIDAAMLVVAADDGPRPQTLEHLELIDALGIAIGLAVVTKVDGVEPARVEAVVTEVRALLAPTSLAGSRVVAASSVTRDGIDAVRAALREIRDRAVAAAGPADAPGGDLVGPLRLAIDRVFAVKGRGTVVTGSLRGGVLEQGATLRREPGGEEVRVRELQVHSSSRARHAGGRAALNLVGLPPASLRRGDVLTHGDGIVATDRLLVERRAPAQLDRPAATRPDRPAPARPAESALRLHVGTDQVAASLRRVPGADSVAILTLERPVATFIGDRGVLRAPASGAVVAGVRVLDPRPPRGVSRRRASEVRLAALLDAVRRSDGPAIAVALTELHGAWRGHAGGPAPTGELALAPDVATAVRTAILEAVAEHHRTVPLSAGLPLARARAAGLRGLRAVATIERRAASSAHAAVAAELDALLAAGALARDGEVVRSAEREARTPPALAAAMARLEEALSVAAPPPLDAAAAAAGCPPEGVHALVAEGRLMRLGPGLAWATATYQHLAARALSMARVAPLTPAAFRDASGTSRKFVLAILEDLDRREILRRTPDGHVPGPRAPRP
jgi:selenocysteine-specific elongation factor